MWYILLVFNLIKILLLIGLGILINLILYFLGVFIIKIFILFIFNIIFINNLKLLINDIKLYFWILKYGKIVLFFYIGSER